MSVDGGTVIIDLGYERGEPESYRSPQRSTVPPWFPVAFLTAVVMLVTAASVPPARSPLTELFAVQIGPADSYTMTDDGRLLAQTSGLLSSYDLATGRTQWEADQATPAYRMRLGADVVLMRPWYAGSRELRTTAIAVGDGGARWTRPGNVVTVAGSPDLLAVSPSRSVSGYERRVIGQVEGVDPVTGRTRWTVGLPSTAVLTGVPALADSPARMLLVHDDRTMTLHDLQTGRLIARRAIPPADYDPSNPAVVNGAVVLRHPGSPDMEVSAYDAATLRPLWSRPADGTYEIRGCGPLACLTGPDGMRAVDPATGDIRWSRGQWRGLQQVGEMYVAYGSAENTIPLGLIDPETGELKVDLTGWRPIGGAGGDDHLLVTRSTDPQGRTMVAVAEPGRAQPRLLAPLPEGTGDCQAVPGRLVCRSMSGQLVVWAYSLKG